MLSRHDVIELFRWMGSLPYASNANTMMEIRVNSDYRNAFWKLLNNPNPLSTLDRGITARLKRADFLAEAFGGSTISQISGAVGTAATAGSVAYTRAFQF